MKGLRMRLFANVFLLISVLLLSSNSMAENPHVNSNSNSNSKSEIKQRIEMMELLPDTPARSFKRIKPIQGVSILTMDRAVEDLKKQAAKVGADAVIEVQMGKNSYSMNTGSVGGSSNLKGGSLFGFQSGGGADYPTISGWAVKWTEGLIQENFPKKD